MAGRGDFEKSTSVMIGADFVCELGRKPGKVKKTSVLPKGVPLIGRIDTSLHISEV